MDVADNNYVLTAGRYVGFADEDMDDIPFDEKINKINAELLDLMNRSDELKRKIITDFDKLNLK
jgi:type I restriction enzyme M protein